MPRPLLMPKLGLTMTEGALAEWRLAPGARFKLDQPLFIVETDKVATEVAAEHDGVLLQIVVPAGETVPVGTVIGYVDGEAAAGALAAPVPNVETEVTSPAAAPAAAARRPVTPLARRLARQAGIDLAAVSGSGPRGRVRARDVEAAQRALPAAAPASTPAKPTPLQATMARRLVAAKQQIPHFYLAAEADVGRLLDLRAELAAAPPAPEAPRITLNHLIVMAVARALRERPQANRVWTDEGIVSFETVDVGVAVSTERGLLVPVVRDLGGRPLAEVARRTRALTERAHAGTLGAADLAGGAITVSNAGMFDVSWMTPIINPGQALILGVGSVRETFRPDARRQPELRREIGLVLAADHRLVDGVAGLQFLNAVIGHLQQPLRLLTGD
jgi:pyruvate dehydrogenase E2 component (dihydrolipoamide acetyltransferase)